MPTGAGITVLEPGTAVSDTSGIITADPGQVVSLFARMEVDALVREGVTKPGELMMARTKPSWPRVTGPLAEHAEGFPPELTRLGYTPLTTAGQMRLVAHMSRWLANEGLDTAGLNPSTVEAYFSARRAAGYTNERTPGAADDDGVPPARGRGGTVPAAAVAVSSTERLLARYKTYLAWSEGWPASSI